MDTNYVTLLSQPFKKEVKPIMVKLEEVLNSKGVIFMTADIRVTYWTDIEFKYDPDLHTNTLNIGNRRLILGTPQPLYNTVRYNTVLYITRLKDGSQKCIDYIEK